MFYCGSSFPFFLFFIYSTAGSLGGVLNSFACSTAEAALWCDVITEARCIELWLYMSASLCLCVGPAVHFIVASRLQACIGQQTDSCSALDAVGWTLSQTQQSLWAVNWYSSTDTDTVTEVLFFLLFLFVSIHFCLKELK